MAVSVRRFGSMLDGSLLKSLPPTALFATFLHHIHQVFSFTHRLTQLSSHDEMCAEKTGQLTPPKCCRVCKQEIVSTTTSGNLGAKVEDTYNQLIPPPSPQFVKRNPENPAFRHCKPPETPDHGNFSLFTAGSIEMGAAVQWQQRLADHLKHLPITITNPRRGHWNPSVDSKREDSDFFDQVKWELDALTAADVICFFFDLTTVSPVTLMELGLWAHSGKIIVCCDQRYWRQGNVEIVCERYNIPYVSSFEKLVPALEEFMKRKGLKMDEQNRFIGSGTGKAKVEAPPGVKEEDRWWLKFQDTNEDRLKKGLEPLSEK
jgi:hypothetical protein